MDGDDARAPPRELEPRDVGGEQVREHDAAEQPPAGQRERAAPCAQLGRGTRRTSIRMTAISWNGTQTYHERKYSSTTVQMPLSICASVPKKTSTIDRTKSATVSCSDASTLQQPRQ